MRCASRSCSMHRTMEVATLWLTGIGCKAHLIAQHLQPLAILDRQEADACDALLNALDDLSSMHAILDPGDYLQVKCEVSILDWRVTCSSSAEVQISSG